MSPGKPSIAIIGPGNLGSALALALAQGGYKITEIVSREQRASQERARALARRVGARAATVSSARLEAGLVWFCVNDGAIASSARELASAGWKGKIALHSSGALTSDELRALRRRSAAVASLHPMMTFTGGTPPSLKGVVFAVEGDAAAVGVCRRIVRDLGGAIFTIAKKKKPLYHAWGAFASPLLVSGLAVAEGIAARAGVERAWARRGMKPIIRQTLENYFAQGAAAAFSGPLVRGDVTTVQKHLRALRQIPGARETYLALARAALQNLPVRNRKALGKIFQRKQ